MPPLDACRKYRRRDVGVDEKIVLTFVNPHAHSFPSGIVITTPAGMRLCRATLCGILGDEKGMKEVFATKGYNGTRPRLHCLNLCQFLPADDESTLVGIDALPESVVPTTDALVWEMVAQLRETTATGTTRELAELEKRLGILHCPGGLLYDPIIPQAFRKIMNTCRCVYTYIDMLTSNNKHIHVYIQQ